MRPNQSIRRPIQLIDRPFPNVNTTNSAAQGGEVRIPPRPIDSSIWETVYNINGRPGQYIHAVGGLLGRFLFIADLLTPFLPSFPSIDSTQSRSATSAT